MNYLLTYTMQDRPKGLYFDSLESAQAFKEGLLNLADFVKISNVNITETK